MPEAPPTVVTAGYMPLDIICHQGRVWRRAGGTAANVAAILAFLGWRAHVAGRLGEDAAGDELLNDLRAAGVETALLQADSGAATNRLVHFVESTGHRYAYSCPGCGQRLPRSRPLTLTQLDGIIDLCPRPDVYFFDRANAATVDLAERYAESGALIVYEPSTPAAANLLHRAMSVANVVKGSDERGAVLVESFPSECPGQVRVVTSGAHGSRFRIGAGVWNRVRTYRVESTDNAGAGDWTTAAILDALVGRPVSREGLTEALLLGHSLAALNCTLPGARALMEGRSRATALGLATKLRNKRRVAPAVSVFSTPPTQPGTCSTCLQHSDGHVRDNGGQHNAVMALR